MGSRNGFDADQELDELANVVDRGSGAISVAQRQANALTNLGLNAGTPATSGVPGSTSGTVPIQLGLFAGSTQTFTFDAEHLDVLQAAYTLGNVTTAQPALNSTTNGAVTLGAGNKYFFEAEYLISNTGTTSHTWSVLFGGTATLTAISYAALGLSGTASGALASGVLFGQSAVATAVVVTAASTSATEFVTVFIKGYVSINAAGTFIPQVKLSAATGTAATMLVGSYFRLWKVPTGPIGTWT